MRNYYKSPEWRLMTLKNLKELQRIESRETGVCSMCFVYGFIAWEETWEKDSLLFGKQEQGKVKSMCVGYLFL